MKTHLQTIIRSNEVVIQYKDDLGNDSNIIVTPEDFFNGELIDANEFNSIVTTKLDALPKIKAKARFVSLLDDTFSISGDFLPLKTAKVSSLAVEEQATVDALKSFILSYTGQPLTSLLGEIGKNKVIINGITYEGQSYADLVSLSEGSIQNAVLLTIEIFNK